MVYEFHELTTEEVAIVEGKYHIRRVWETRPTIIESPLCYVGIDPRSIRKITAHSGNAPYKTNLRDEYAAETKTNPFGGL